MRTPPLPPPGCSRQPPLRGGRLFLRGKADINVRRIRNASTPITGPSTRPNPQRHRHPNAHRRPKPPQQHPAGYTHQRETKAKHPAQTQRRSHPNAHRRPKPPQQHPAGQTHPRKTKGPGVRVRQDNPTQRGPQGPDNPHPAAVSRASGSNCGRRCTRTYPAQG